MGQATPMPRSGRPLPSKALGFWGSESTRNQKTRRAEKQLEAQKPRRTEPWLYSLLLMPLPPNSDLPWHPHHGCYGLEHSPAKMLLRRTPSPHSNVVFCSNITFSKEASTNCPSQDRAHHPFI